LIVLSFVFWFLLAFRKTLVRKFQSSGKKNGKNCVDYVAHTCAVPEGRAATENVGDRQEWFKTDFSLGVLLLIIFFIFFPFWVCVCVGWGLLSLSSLLLPFGFVFSPPTSSQPTTTSCFVSGGTKGKKKGGETTRKRCARGGEHTTEEEDGRGRPTGHRPSHPTSSSSSSSNKLFLLLLSTGKTKPKN
jgi:hypothetical protein